MKRASPKSSMPDSKESNYQVGYGGPPKSGQFQPGNKAHLKRRNKSKMAGAQFARVMGEKVLTTASDAQSHQSRLQLLVDNCVAAACRGDMRSAADLLRMHSTSKPVGNMRRVVLIFDAEDAKL